VGIHRIFMGRSLIFGISCLLLSPLFTFGESRRALLVGIDNYNPNAADRARIARAEKPAAAARPAVQGNATYWRFENLDGARNDLKLIQAVLEGLGITDFVVLADQDATADAILAALQKNLVDDAQPGDVRIFYYSGHGNHVRNLASKEQGGEDQTLVPADNWRDTPDVRDKEISRILWKAAAKGVKVTFIADSCHSGSLARGAWNATGKARSNSGRRAAAGTNPLRELVANDPATADPRTGEPIDPEKLGVLTLAAAQSSEEARETDTDDGPHGAFTWALARALKYSGEPMSRILQRVSAELHAAGVPQQPVMGGAGRESRDLFGNPAGPGGELTILVESVNGKEVHLRGGQALGLGPECRLTSLKDPALELRITASSLGAATAEIAGAGEVAPGDVFRVSRWVVPSQSVLGVYVPKPAPADLVAKVGAEIGGLSDDAVENPTHVMSWSGRSWILEQNPASGAPKDLGVQPSADDVRRALPPNARFLLLLPPAAGLTEGVHLASPIESRPAGSAEYRLDGRWHDGRLEYAWVRTALKADLPMPARSDWVPAGPQAAASLQEKALLLARIHGWLTLESPPTRQSFPYHLAFQNVATKQLRTSGDLVENERYKLFLQADPASLQNPQALSPRWVYIFAIDHFGKGSLLFPVLGHGNEGNRLPYAQADARPRFDALIPVDGADYDFSIGEPFGVDSYFLLTSQEPIDQPDLFEFDGLRTRAASRSAADPLTDLLSGLASGTRAPHRAQTPGTWSIENLTFRSVPAAK
jgi:hypothetical protein